jgi:hypothetical protein
MDLDSRGYFKLIDEYNTHGGSEEYIRIVDAIHPLTKRHDHETPEMWCSRICDPFRKILEEKPRILSKNGFITMHGNYMMVVGLTAFHQITYIVVYATPWFSYLKMVLVELIAIEIAT